MNKMTPIKFIEEIMHKKNRLIAISLVLNIGSYIITRLIMNRASLSERTETLITGGVLIISTAFVLISNKKADNKIRESSYDRIEMENYEFAKAVYEHKLYEDSQIIPVIKATQTVMKSKSKDIRIGGA
jgi:hypothetical protein